LRENAVAMVAVVARTRASAVVNVDEDVIADEAI
jgi:hypothetical protein